MIISDLPAEISMCLVIGKLLYRGPCLKPHSFIYSFIHSFIHSFTHSFIQLFIHSFIHSFMLRASVPERWRARPQTARAQILSGGQCHLNHLTMVRMFSWPSLALCAQRWPKTPFMFLSHHLPETGRVFLTWRPRVRRSTFNIYTLPFDFAWQHGTTRIAI